MTEVETAAPLRGVTVIELGNYIAAPTASRLLADFGATVIKVERPRSGDEVRLWRIHGDEGTSMLFRTLNRNKKSIVLDLRSEQGREIVLKLAARADILLENFRPGTLEKWGLGPEKLDSVNPDLIIARVSAFGQTGPRSHLPGFGAVAEAFSGFRNLVGEPDRPPVRVGLSIADSIAGMYAAFGAVMALYEREARGGGAGIPLDKRVIDVALHEAMFSVTESLIPDQSLGIRRSRTGGSLEGIAPSNAYLCADDSSIVIAGNGDGIFKRLMDVIGRPDLGADPELADNERRWLRRLELDQAIGEWTGRRTAAEALEQLEKAGVPAGLIYTAEDILAEEQYAVRDMIQYRDVPTSPGVTSKVAFPGIVPVIGERSLPIESLGPELGEHSREILEDFLGMSRAEAEALITQMQSASE